MGRTADAMPAVRRALELSPAHAEAQRLLAAITARQGAAPVEPTPQTPEQWMERSLTRYRIARYQESADAARKALELRPDFAEAYNNVCAAENAMGRHAEAAAACERALAIKPDFPLARNNLQVALTKLGK